MSGSESGAADQQGSRISKIYNPLNVAYGGVRVFRSPVPEPAEAFPRSPATGSVRPGSPWLA